MSLIYIWVFGVNSSLQSSALLEESYPHTFPYLIFHIETADRLIKSSHDYFLPLPWNLEFCQYVIGCWVGDVLCWWMYDVLISISNISITETFSNRLALKQRYSFWVLLRKYAAGELQEALFYYLLPQISLIWELQLVTFSKQRTQTLTFWWINYTRGLWKWLVMFDA